MTPGRCAAAVGCAVALATGAVGVRAEPLVPTSDAQIVEVLPGNAPDRDLQRRLRATDAARPVDARLAVTLARRDLQRARDEGDPRYAGMALAALRPWSDAATAPDDVLLLRATLQQFLHDFDGAVALLETLLARPTGARSAEAWLTLATVRRVQGRYAASDEACGRLDAAGAPFYARACLAENAGLRGDVDAARSALMALVGPIGAGLVAGPAPSAAGPRATSVAELPAPTPGAQAWILTTLAELEQRAGRPRAAEVAFKASLDAAPDPYTTLAYADFLIDARRPADALRRLAAEPRTDAVVLRLAIAGAAAARPGAARDAAEFRERIALANQRPGAEHFHAREQAMFALRIDRSPERAWALARDNVTLQREAIDLLVLAEAAVSTGDPAARDEARRIRAETGLFDRRADALLR